jgi:Flp pilus assembly protein TadD
MLRSITSLTILAATALQAAPAAADHIVMFPNEAGVHYWSQQDQIVWSARKAMTEGRYVEAAEMLNGISLTHMPDINRLAGIANAKAGNLPEAETYLELALVRDARDSVAAVTLGLVRLQLGKRAEAEELMRSLQKRQQRCGSRCERAAEIDKATEVLARALG